MSALAVDSSRAVLVIIDVQERLAAAMPETDRAGAIRNIVLLLEAARRFSLPVLVTEQYPKGLGHTVPEIREQLGRLEPPPTIVEKVAFDAYKAPELAQTLEKIGRTTVVITGMEAHICVWQTARSLATFGMAVHVPIDAVCSRSPLNRRIAEGLLERAGVTVTTTETVLFDLIERGEGEHFKAISRLLK